MKSIKISTKCLPFYIALIGSIFLGLSGCAFIYPPSGSGLSNPLFIAVGRVIVKLDQNNHSARFRWVSSRSEQEVLLFTTLGGTVAKINVKNRNFSIMDSSGKLFRARSSEDLMMEVLGWSIPVTGLKHWLIGEVNPLENVDNLVLDELGRISSLKQGEWSISYTTYKKNSPYPKKIRLVSGELSLKIVIDKWLVENYKYAKKN
tara:strand:- start:422 stop:1033 length:612 start_codon:yes stop_codon:yes gene_type:complete